MEYVTALGRCTKCGQDKISVEGINKCLSCDSDNNVGSGLVVRAEDPGADMLEKLLSKAGVAVVPGGKPPEPIRPNIAQKVANVSAPKVQTEPGTVFESHIMNAVSWLRSMPMPSDIKKFKAVNKAIKILESLGA